MLPEMTGSRRQKGRREAQGITRKQRGASLADHCVLRRTLLITRCSSLSLSQFQCAWKHTAKASASSVCLPLVFRVSRAASLSLSLAFPSRLEGKEPATMHPQSNSSTGERHRQITRTGNQSWQAACLSLSPSPSHSPVLPLLSQAAS